MNSRALLKDIPLRIQLHMYNHNHGVRLHLSRNVIWYLNKQLRGRGIGHHVNRISASQITL
jgi:riboflavin transporter FmnP